MTDGRGAIGLVESTNRCAECSVAANGLRPKLAETATEHAGTFGLYRT